MFYEEEHIGLSYYFKKEYGENFSYPPHLHMCYELIILLEGNMEVSVNGKNYVLNKNDSLLIFPNQLHSLQSSVSKHVLFIFSPKIIQAFTAEKSKLLPSDNRLNLTENIISDLLKLDSSSSKYELKGVLYSVCALFEKNACYNLTNYDNNDLLIRIFNFVEKNYNSCCTLKCLSNETGYSYTYLSKFFKKIMNISFNNYVNIYRINQAGYILNNSNCSILDCAIEVGYSSLRSFNRNFKTYFKITPHEYRHKKRGC